MTIELSNGKAAVIDSEDLPIVLACKWYAVESARKGVFYAAATRKKSGKTLFMHRLITGASPGLVVDHRNRDGLDNRKTNLRVCTNAQNRLNQRLRSDNTTGLRGVSFDRITKTWQAKIQMDGRTIHLGRFCSPKEAALAYDTAARRFHGEFASFNYSESAL